MRFDGIGKPFGHGVPRCLVRRSRELSASDFDVAPLLSASDVFDRHFCDAFAVAIDEFYKVSINVVLLKPLVQTHALDDLNRAAADKIGRAHVSTPVTNAHLVCRLLLEKKKHKTPYNKSKQSKLTNNEPANKHD